MKHRIPLCFFFLLLLSCASANAQRQKSAVRTAPTLDRSVGASTIDPQSNLDTRIGELSRQISDGLTENQKRTIAVVEFVDLKGRVTDLGRFLAEKLITRLYQTKKFKVIERQLLNKIVNEQKLSLTGMIDQSTAQRLGKLLGVDAIAAGTVTDLGKTLDINARLISTQTGEIFAVASVEITKDEAVLKLMEKEEDAPNADEAKTQSDPKRSQKMDAEFFTFELLQCKLSGTTVLCELLITNHDVERRLMFGRVNVLFDSSGDSHQWRGGQLANVSSNVYPPTGAVLVSGVRTKARITFDGVPTQATMSPLLSLSFIALKDVGFGGGQTFKIEFRNVPLR